MCFLKDCQATGKQLKVNNCVFWPLGQQGYCFIENENLKLGSQGSGERRAMRLFLLHSGNSKSMKPKLFQWPGSGPDVSRSWPLIQRTEDKGPRRCAKVARWPLWEQSTARKDALSRLTAAA